MHKTSPETISNQPSADKSYLVPVGVAGVVLVIGLLTSGLALHVYPMLDGNASLVDGFTWTALSLFLFWFWARGYINRHAKAKALFLIVGFMGISGFFLASFGIIASVNGYYDISERKERSALIEKKEHQRSRDNTEQYLVYIKLLNNPDILRAYEIRKPLFDKVVEGRSKLVFGTRAGYLGYEWYEDMRVENANEAQESNESSLE